MYSEFKNHLERQLDDIEQQGLTKSERILQSAQGENVQVDSGKVLNLCANNYLGLAQHPEVVEKMRAAYDAWWKATRPLMVNENVPMSPTRPFHELYKKQLENTGIPAWQPPSL